MKYFIVSIFIFLNFSSIVFAEMTLFIADGCSFCEKVEEYINKNNLEKELDIKILEINNAENNALFFKTAKEIGYTNEQVPLLVIGDEYYQGANLIISFLKENEGVITNSVVTKLNKEDSEFLSQSINKEKKENNSNSNNDTKIVKIIGALIIFSGLGLSLKIIKRALRMKKNS